MSVIASLNRQTGWISTAIGTDQRHYWELQHCSRAEEHRQIESVPNSFAVHCAELFTPESRVVEIGPGNGRDARYFVRHKQCTVYAVDIAQNALSQLQAAALCDGTFDNLIPIVSSVQQLTGEMIGSVDAFYARSALHLSEPEWKQFLSLMTNALNPGGDIMIEGKSFTDPKIKRSIKVDENLFSDTDGHLRRAWNKTMMSAFVAQIGYSLIDIRKTTETWGGVKTHFISCIAQKPSHESHRIRNS